MPRWTYEALEQAIAQFGLAGDPSDPKVRKRTKLLRAATELFVEQGYRKTSVDEIAARAAVAKGTVYLYFRNKGELLLYAVVEEKKRYFGRLKPMFDEAVPPRERLKLWLRAALVIGQEMPLISRLLQGDLELLAALEDMPAGAVTEGRLMGIDFLSELVDLAAAPHRYNEHELRDRAEVLYALVHLGGRLQSEKIRGGLSVERFAAILADLIVDGIQAGGETP